LLLRELFGKMCNLFPEDNSHAPGLEYTLLTEKDPGIQYKAVEAETSKAKWLNQVDDKGEKLLYQSATDWELQMSRLEPVEFSPTRCFKRGNGLVF
jgi:hypothetical protein